ncbi:hypothetical protein [Streptosporangium sp. NPDC087985]|uniref:mechanosensitive ion channel family protein n=1 Tax=Streptosporangium sp. NPDC087985 TaxID=3366196 RepID=UPI00380E9381
MSSALWTEAVKAIPNLVVALLTLSLGWFVGNRLTARWDERKKRRELDLVALSVFYEIYGQFFAIWKLWSGARKGLPENDEFRREVLGRAAEAEGRLESLLVRIASERDLSDRDCILVGCFRQGFQSLRESIRNNEDLRSRLYTMSGKERLPVRWTGSEAPPYIAFKALAAYTANLLAKSSSPATKAESASSTLKKITSNRLEGTWVAEAFTLLDLKSPSWPIKQAAVSKGVSKRPTPVSGEGL